MNFLTKQTALLITALLSTPALAETDSFDMAVSGEFDKDHCSLSHEAYGAFTSVTLNTSTMDFYHRNGYVMIAARIMSIVCNRGTYNVTASTDAPDSIIDGNNTYSTLATITIKNAPEKNLAHTLVSSSSPLTTTNITYPTNNYRIQTNAGLIPTDGDIFNLNDTYSYSVNTTLTIEWVSD